MTIITIYAEGVSFPSKCCSCGGKDYDTYTHTDRVAVWDLGFVSKSRHISLDIPLCKRCVNAKWKWYGAGAVIAGLGWFRATASYDANGAIPMAAVALLFIACALVYIGGRKPVKILRYNEQMHSLKLRISNDAIARLVARASAKR
ncbi:hypothetical protein AAKU55_000810 [Oxalobacteraceae bacterium GrIS 1.11]